MFINNKHNGTAAGLVVLLVAALPVYGQLESGPAKIAHFRLAGPLAEAPSEFGMFTFGPEPPASLKSLLERFRKARKDPSVKAVILTFDEPTMGWAQVEELRDAIAQFRAADKEVYCHVESLDTQLYYLASAATYLSMVPTADLYLIGLHGESTYLKGTLDKLNCQADLEHIGEYKSASETFTRTGPSPEAEAMQNWLFDSLYAQIVKGIAKSRRMSEDQVRQRIDAGPYSAETALKAKLIDAVQHRQTFIEDVKQRYGRDVEIAVNYKRRKGPDVDFSSPFGIFKLFGDLMGAAKVTSKPAIGVVYAEGMIVPGRSQESIFGGKIMGSTTLRAALDKARKDPSIKAVVLRVDSPGGSVTASEIIYDAGKRLAAEKPFIVSMGNVAGSGGYYISVGARTIFAEPTTITGSIGVVGGKIVSKGLWEMIGMTTHEYTRGKNADLLNSNRPFTDAQRKKIRDWMTDIYTIFTKRVTDGRGDRLTQPIEKIARGRVFTGAQAIEKGLVDKLGGLDDAIRFAAREARIGVYDIRVLPKPKTIFELMMEGFGMGEPDEDDLHTAPRLGLSVSESPLLKPLLPLLRAADPARAAALGRMLLRVELLRRFNVLAVIPTEYLVR